MPRRARIYTGEGVFHILTRGNNKQIVFMDEEDFHKYKEVLKRLKNEQPFKLYHYCLMSTHVHLIVETNELTNLPKLMKRVNLLYYHHYNRKYGYTGHFWQDRFKSLLIERNKYLLSCGLYVERNPVSAKIVDSAENYPHSSYKHYAYGEKDELIDKDIYYNELGRDDKKRQQEYRRLIVKEDKVVNRAMGRQLFLGTKEFIERMEERFKVSNIRLERGRPKKK